MPHITDNIRCEANLSAWENLRDWYKSDTRDAAAWTGAPSINQVTVDTITTVAQGYIGDGTSHCTCPWVVAVDGHRRECKEANYHRVLNEIPSDAPIWNEEDAEGRIYQVAKRELELGSEHCICDQPPTQAEINAWN